MLFDRVWLGMGEDEACSYVMLCKIGYFLLLPWEDVGSGEWLPINNDLILIDFLSPDAGYCVMQIFRILW